MHGSAAYYVHWRDRAGLKKATARVYDFRTAQDDLAKKLVELAEGRSDVTPREEHDVPGVGGQVRAGDRACLSAAVDEGCADRNPVAVYRKPLVLRRAAVETGAWIGELVALDWKNVNLTAGRVDIRHTYSQDEGLTAPKGRDERTIHLTPAAAKIFEDWVSVVSVRESGPLFEAPRGGYVNDDYIRKLVNAAIDDAGIPKNDERTHRRRNPFHSLRTTYARRMLESGRSAQWVRAQMGHWDLVALTIDTYGSWSEEAMLPEAAKS